MSSWEEWEEEEEYEEEEGGTAGEESEEEEGEESEEEAIAEGEDWEEEAESEETVEASGGGEEEDSEAEETEGEEPSEEEEEGAELGAAKQRRRSRPECVRPSRSLDRYHYNTYSPDLDGFSRAALRQSLGEFIRFIRCRPTNGPQHRHWIAVSLTIQNSNEHGRGLEVAGRRARRLRALLRSMVPQDVTLRFDRDSLDVRDGPGEERRAIAADSLDVKDGPGEERRAIAADGHLIGNAKVELWIGGAAADQ
jgi:hypothetical protein